MALKFQRQVEDFKCEHCGADIGGDGYTNHCSVCLWSKHVDVNPGDRASDCGGMMPPVEFGQHSGDFYVIHQCQKCGHRKKNKISPQDQWQPVFESLKEKNNG